MSEPSILANAPVYTPMGGAYDEAHDGVALREHWAGLFAMLGAEGAQNLMPRLAANIERLRAEQALSTAAASSERPWQLDPLPLLLAAQDWEVLERGIIQRCELLSRIVEDFYGSTQVLSSGLLPPALAFANPGYVLPACGMDFPKGPLSILAFDLGRAPDGSWWVLNNRTDAPTGLGYVLENRIVMARGLPQDIDRQNVERLASFYRRYSDSLQNAEQREPDQAGIGAEALTVILSDGPLSASYAEHAYLGRYLGLPVIEGDDLSVRGGTVALKTLEGLKPVRSIMRQIASDLCDPLELRSDSLYGTPGLLDSARQGRVSIGNAIGSGVVENDAIMGFLPGLSEALLGESLKLPSIATWWCGQRDAQQHVLENLDRLSLRNAFESKRLLSSSVAEYLASDFAPQTHPNLEQTMRTQAYRFVGRETMQLSTVPYFDEALGIRSAPMTLRLFATRTADGFAVMPGGLARVATPNGDISKDVWIPKSHGRAFPPPTEQAAVTRRTDKNLPSRTADDLFWLGRYLERAEGAVRLYRALFRSVSGDDSMSDEAVTPEQITDLLVGMGVLSEQKAESALAEGLQGIDRELWHLLFDSDSADGLANILANVNRTAHRVRSRQSTDAWRIYERLQQVPHLRWRTHTTTDVIALLDDVIEKLSALAGKSAENMTRGYGWRLLELGKRIERTRFTSRLLRELCSCAEELAAGTLTLLLDVTDNTITHRARYRGEPSALTVLDLLLVDGSNPRSIMHQISEMAPHMAVMPQESREHQLSDSQRILLTLQNELTLADVDRLINRRNREGERAHLSRQLKRLDQAMINLSRIISQTYFAHTREVRH